MTAVDHENGDLAVFETGSIMWYLCEKLDKEGKFWPKVSANSALGISISIPSTIFTRHTWDPR